MNTEPKLEARAEQPYVAIPIKAPMKEWGKVNALVPEVYGWLAQRGIATAGPLFYRYRVVGDMDRPFDLEVGVPVEAAVPGDGRVVPGHIQAGTYVTATHQGHPDRLRETLILVEDWAAAQGIKWNNRRDGDDEVWGGRFEFYLTDPEVEPDYDKWSIEVANLVA